MDSLCQEWCEGQGLDEACLIKLLELDDDTRQTVINGFQPKPGTKNVCGLFMGYVRSIQLASGQGIGKGAAVQPQWKGFTKGGPKGPSKGVATVSVAQNAAAQLQEEAFKFGASWGLDEDCVAELLAQPPQVVADVMASFSPKSTTRNVRSLFFSFLKSVADGSRGGPVVAAQPLMSTQPVAYSLEDEATSFVQQFGLDEECLRQLLQQQPDVVRAVMAGFQPRDDTQNLHGLFMSYLRSVATGFKGSKGMAKGGVQSVFGAAPRSTQQGIAARATPYRQPTPMSGKGGGVPRAFAPLVSEQELLDFALAWQLDQDCLDFLQTQDSDIQRLVLSNFRPKGGTANVSGLFMSYVNSLLRAGKGGKGIR